MQNADWQQRGSAVVGLATATRPAESGNRHSIVAVSASYSAAQVGLLQIKVGANVVWERYVHNACDIDLTGAIRGSNGAAVSAELAAGAAGVTGTVTISGVTA
jgi:co-chaperonin GroES (HSP10)